MANRMTPPAEGQEKDVLLVLDKQIESADDGYIVKDDIESGYANVIPLWAFGLNY